MKLVWLPKACSDLDAVVEYLAQYNQSAAWQMYEKIRSKIELLSEQPGIGRPGRVPQTRELVITGTPFVVPYTVVQALEAVVILRVLHGAQHK